MKTTALILAMVLLGGCTWLEKQEAKSDENLLTAAGFRIKPADSPQRAEQLATMPPLQMQQRITDGNVVYTYADPYRCQCLYVGNEANYQEYKRLGVEQQIAQENMAASMAAEDAAMDWGMWGPWWW